MFSRRVLDLDCQSASETIEAAIRDLVLQRFRRKGVVVGCSGGIDSSVVAALAARAVGSERVLGLFLPEFDSSPESLELGKSLAAKFRFATETVDIGPALRAMECYSRRDAAIRTVIPEFGEGWKSKIVLPALGDQARLNVFSVVARAPDGREVRARLPLEPYLTIVAASNMKQRTRKLTEYFHAERLNYAVAGTPNRLEYDQGFFVKGGDGLADFKPIAHLYKSQVYALAEYLGVPEEIRRRPPTTDTYSMPQTQEEFYFALPYDRMDLCLWAYNHGVPASDVAQVLGLPEGQVDHVFRDIEAKRRTTLFLHLKPVLIEDVPEIRAS